MPESGTSAGADLPAGSKRKFEDEGVPNGGPAGAGPPSAAPTAQAAVAEPGPSTGGASQSAGAGSSRPPPESPPPPGSHGPSGGQLRGHAVAAASGGFSPWHTAAPVRPAGADRAAPYVASGAAGAASAWRPTGRLPGPAGVAQGPRLQLPPGAFWATAEWADATRPLCGAGDLEEWAAANTPDDFPGAGAAPADAAPPLQLVPQGPTLAQATLSRRPRDPG